MLSILSKDIDTMDEKELANKIYDIAKDAEIEPSELFTSAYRVLIARDKGPRLAGFLKAIGAKKASEILGR